MLRRQSIWSSGGYFIVDRESQRASVAVVVCNLVLSRISTVHLVSRASSRMDLAVLVTDVLGHIDRSRVA